MTELQKKLDSLVGSKRDQPRLRGVRGSYRFDVTNVGSWRADVADGVVTFSKSDKEADCVIASDADDFERIYSGQQNLITAAMQGRVGVEGDVALAQKLNAVLPGKEGAPPAKPEKPGAKEPRK
jgi:hypothetical protein